MGSDKIVKSITMLQAAITREPVIRRPLLYTEALTIKIDFSVDTVLVRILSTDVPVCCNWQALYCATDLRRDEEQSEENKHPMTRFAKSSVNGRYRRQVSPCC